MGKKREIRPVVWRAKHTLSKRQLKTDMDYGPDCYRP